MKNLKKKIRKNPVSTHYIAYEFYKKISYFQASTKTHCEVDNFAPSISAAIGSFLPQKYIWQTCICLHISPRFAFLLLYKHFYQTRLNLNNSYTTRQLVQSAAVFNCIELFSLLGLTLVSSQEDFDIHKICFVAFGLSGLVYFIITWYIWTFCGLPLERNEEVRSLRIKTRALQIFLGCGLCMSYLYYRHNEYCEPYVYRCPDFYKSRPTKSYILK